MGTSTYLNSDSDEDDSFIVPKRRKTCRLLEDSSDEEEEGKKLEDTNLAGKEDDTFSDDSDGSAKTEVIVDADNLVTDDVGAVDEDLNDLISSRDCSGGQDEDDDDFELLSIHSDDGNYSQPVQVANQLFDSDETSFEDPMADTSLPSSSLNEPGTSSSFFESSSTKNLLTRRKRIPFPSSKAVSVEDDDDDIQDGSSSSTNFEPCSSSSSSADFGSDTDFKVSRNQRKKVVPLTQSAPLSCSPAKFETVSDEDDEDFDPVIPVPRRDRAPAPAPLTTEPRWINMDSPDLDFDTPPPVYNPAAASKADWMGDVQRTVHMMDETIKGMPLPDDEGNEDVKLPPGLAELYPHQKYALRWMSWREGQFPGGGILADEMGLGKTIEIIALIMKSKWDAGIRAGGKVEKMVTNEEAGRCVPSRTTLVVCPLGCIGQWCREMETKGKDLRVHTYHGSKKLTSAAEIAKYDVVVTTYQTIASEIPKPSPEGQKPRRCRSPLKRVYWVRIVLDEAHQIRNPKTNAAQALFQLEARHRWAVTGTPIHNRPEDFYSMCTFLRLEPFNDRAVWDFWIGLKTVKRGAEQRLHVLGKALILRRTKEEVGLIGAEDGGGKSKVQVIPPKSVEVVTIELREEERRIYDMLMDYAQSILQKFLSQKEQREHGLRLGGLFYAADRVQERREQCPDDIKFSHIFALLTRLRQCAVLPHLIETMLDREEIGEDEKFDELKPEHIVSKINPVFNRLYLSSKFEKIIEDVDKLRAKATNSGEPMDKVIIVSSWTSTLDIIYEHLRNKNYNCVFITGRDDMNIRMENMDRFNKNKWRPQILLLSLMAGGVGLNLIGANHVFFVEPHWNPQHELQAQDRIHRFGQMKNVYIRRYISDDTIETRIMELQEQKKELADGLLSNSRRIRGAGISLEQMKRLFEIY